MQQLGRQLQFGYGLAAYFLFLGTLLYVIGFANAWFVPNHIDNSIPGSGLGGFAINAGLLLLFAVQHTIMARPAFKRWWTRIIPPAVERSTFVVFSSLILILMTTQWRTYPEVVWSVQNAASVWLIHGIALFGYLLAVYSTFLIDHFGLFGVKQVWANLRGKTLADPSFKTPWLYQRVRNPLMLGFLIGFWAVPTMTVGHLFFCVLLTAYVFVGVLVFEERDIANQLGEEYRRYKARTPMLVPRLATRTPEMKPSLRPS